MNVYIHICIYYTHAFTGTYTDIHAYRKADIHTYIHTYRQTDRQTVRHTDAQIYRQTYMHAYR